jgi:hypothetical protein
MWARLAVPKVVVALALGAVLLMGAGGLLAARWLGVPPLHHYGPESGPITAELISPENVRLRILTVERGATRWLFHIHAHNNTTQRVIVWGGGSDADHYFTLGGVGVAGTSYTGDQLFLRLTATTVADSAAHPALPPTVNGGSNIDGWLAADFSHFPYPSDGFLYYVYGTVTTTACASLTDRSTCHPSTGYRTMVWRLS